jgi:hypothetical protein
MSLDRFSAQAAQYARYRIDYPSELYAWLLPQVAGRLRAWDCATGNGQVAAVLAQHFQEVEATDLSANQLAQAPALPNVHYQVATAEHTPFPDERFDLITVAQAVHWFDLPAYHTEVRRVSGPGTVLAEWGYGLVQIGEPALDALVLHFHNETVGPYWDANRCTCWTNTPGCNFRLLGCAGRGLRCASNGRPSGFWTTCARGRRWPTTPDSTTAPMWCC